MAPRADRWVAHPALARCVRVAVVLVPVLVSVLVALFVIWLLPEPDSLLGEIGWWTAVLASAFVAARTVDRLARKALPLEVLLRLSLVFPDRAPSRLKAARRTSLREIESQVAALHAAGEQTQPSQAAHALVSLVGALGLHDKRTRGHSERVRAYVDMLTEEMGLDEDDRVRLRWAALLHDIGKLSVPGSVLNGGKDLGSEEWASLRLHPEEGERIARGLLPWLGEWGRCLREHHERWDGTGYPQALKGTEISLGARIVAVADAYEVMTANRSYQKAITPAAARLELSRCAGADFDPAVVRAFLQISLGRLRGALGPLSFLTAAPFFATDRVGDVGRNITTVAAASAVALSLAPAPAVTRLPAPSLGAGGPVVLLPRPTPALTPTAVPSRTPAPSPSATSPVATATVEPALRTPAPPTPPLPVPSVVVLYLGQGSLSTAPTSAGVVTLRPAGPPATFGLVVDAPLVLRGVPSLVVFHHLQPRKGIGNPRAVLSAALQTCTSGTCRVLSSGSVALRRSKSAYVEQRVPLKAVDAVLSLGQELRVAISLRGTKNVRSVSVAYGGARPSRLLLP